MPAPPQPVQTPIRRCTRGRWRLTSLRFLGACGLAISLAADPAAAQNPAPDKPAAKTAGDAEKPRNRQTANSLRDYFDGQSYKPGSVVANRQLNENAVVVFRGADAQDRLVLMVLHGSTAAEGKDEKAPRPRPLSLELSCIADAEHPDGFRIPKGQF